MAEYIETFARMEKKYSMSAEQFGELIGCIGGRIRPDLYFDSEVNSLYFDTPDRRLIRHSMEKPVYKEKLRLRTYGSSVSENTTAFAEIKKKYDGCVYKRRVDGTYSELLGWLSGTARCPGDSQIHREIDYFVRRYEDLKPAMRIAYRRLAYVLKEDPAVRITFDREVLWRDSDLNTQADATGRVLLSEDTVLMEIKVLRKAIPLWLIQTMDELGIRPSSLSKYGAAYMISTSAAPVQYFYTIPAFTERLLSYV